ncbi:MAG: hypothetical protein Q7T54_01595 [Candidatus Levybacteria bacterium]|nr:hypothetical protein [Candidatus Levybacteria bacterium]
MKKILVLILTIVAVSFTACGDRPDTQEPKVPTQAPRIPTPAAPAQPGITMPRSSSCTNSAVILTGIALDQTVFDSQVTSFNLLGCFTRPDIFVEASPQLGYVLSLAIADRNAKHPFKDVEELTKFSEEFLTDFVKVTLGDSYLVLENVKTTYQLRLFPVIKKKTTGPTA